MHPYNLLDEDQGLTQEVNRPKLYAMHTAKMARMSMSGSHGCILKSRTGGNNEKTCAMAFLTYKDFRSGGRRGFLFFPVVPPAPGAQRRSHLMSVVFLEMYAAALLALATREAAARAERGESDFDDASEESYAEVEKLLRAAAGE